MIFYSCSSLKIKSADDLIYLLPDYFQISVCSQAAVILSVVALASAGVVQLAGHGYGGEEYGHEAIAYAPVAVAPVAHYAAHEDTHVDYHVRKS